MVILVIDFMNTTYIDIWSYASETCSHGFWWFLLFFLGDLLFHSFVI